MSGELDRKLRELFGPQVSITRKQGIGGGCINQTSILHLDTGQRVFLKENSRRYPDLFRAEAAGLIALAEAGALRVPAPYSCWEEGDRQFLLIECIEEGTRAEGFWEEFGRSLANLHAARSEGRFGFEIDNFIGANPQPNRWNASWPSFFGEQRLGFQLALALRGHGASLTWAKPLERLLGRLDRLLPEPDHPSLLHGDLWGGNYMVDASGAPVLIDPAVYFGHPEADLAMTELFGGFGERFYRAYREVSPLEPGYSERRDLYNLYHLLNHFNLFGGSYAASVEGIVRRYA